MSDKEQYVTNFRQGTRDIVVPFQIIIRVQSQIDAAADEGNAATQETYDATAEAVQIDQDYSNRDGYDPAFLGADTLVPFPRLTGLMKSDVVYNNQPKAGLPRYILPYHRYSLVMSQSRRLAYFTAVNIDGMKIQEYDRSGDRWFYDPRIPKSAQIGNELYTHNEFDRGHLVRRRDACWGRDLDDAILGNNDTFHYTNCSPQHSFFNQDQSLWQGLENYILESAEKFGKKVCLFNGPIFDVNDPIYRGVAIPRAYWKLAVIKKQDGKMSATAYVVHQDDLIADIQAAGDFQYGEFLTFQTTVEHLETLTGLNFGRLSEFDPKRDQTAGEVLSPQMVRAKTLVQLTELSQIEL
jgi:endonuclease G, mitochondrial